MSSRARRPYLMGKESVGDFYKSDVRFLKEIVGRESEFEKPYEDEDYRKMHFDFPWPDWPPFPPIGHMPDIPGPTPGLSLCAITCYTPLDCDEPIWCHPSIWCGNDLGCTLCHWGVEGATLGYTIHRMSEGWNWGIDVWVDSTLVESGGEALIHVQMKDPCGNLCGRDVEVTCKVCPADVVMTWASGDLTVARNATVGVAVADGLGIYSWSVSGTGFSMLHAITDGISNSVIADATACGTATITVTDFCETVVTGYVRCTEGQWTEVTFDSCVISGAITEGDGLTRIQDKWKLVEVWAVQCSSAGFGCSGPVWGQCVNNYATCKCRDLVDCHEPMGCTQCLEHGGICNQAGYAKACFSPADCLCCVDSGDECDGAVNNVVMCNRSTSKLYEWTCIP